MSKEGNHNGKAYNLNSETTAGYDDSSGAPDHPVVSKISDTQHRFNFFETVANETEPFIENETEPFIENETEPFFENETEPFIENETEPFIENETEPFIENETELSTEEVSVDIPVVVLHEFCDTQTRLSFYETVANETEPFIENETKLSPEEVSVESETERPSFDEVSVDLKSDPVFDFHDILRPVPSEHDERQTSDHPNNDFHETQYHKLAGNDEDDQDYHETPYHKLARNEEDDHDSHETPYHPPAGNDEECDVKTKKRWRSKSECLHEDLDSQPVQHDDRALTDIMRELQSENQMLRQQSEYKEKINDLQRQLDVRTKQLENYKRENDLIQKERNVYKTQHDELAEKLSTRERENAFLILQNKNAASESNRHFTRLQMTTNEMAEQQQEFAEKVDELQDEFANRLADQEKEFENRLAKRQNEFANHMNNLQQKLAFVEEENGTLTLNVKNSLSENNRYFHWHQMTTNIVAQQQQEFMDLKGRNNELQLELDFANARADMYEIDIRALSKMNQRQQCKIQILTAQSEEEEEEELEVQSLPGGHHQLMPPAHDANRARHHSG